MVKLLQTDFYGIRVDLETWSVRNFSSKEKIMTLEQEQGILYDPEMKELLDYFRKENDK